MRKPLKLEGRMEDTDSATSQAAKIPETDDLEDDLQSSQEKSSSGRMWQDSWVSAAPVLVGTVIGALATIAATHISVSRQQVLEQKRWEREDAARFSKERLELYSDYLRRTEDLRVLYGERLDYFGSVAKDIMSYRITPLSRKVDDAEEALYLSLERVRLIAGPEVRNGAEEMMKLLHGLDLETINLTDAAISAFHSRSEQLGLTNRAVTAEMRRELGISNSQVGAE